MSLDIPLHALTLRFPVHPVSTNSTVSTVFVGDCWNLPMRCEALVQRHAYISSRVLLEYGCCLPRADPAPSLCNVWRTTAPSCPHWSPDAVSTHQQHCLAHTCRLMLCQSINSTVWATAWPQLNNACLTRGAAGEMRICAQAGRV